MPHLNTWWLGITSIAHCLLDDLHNDGELGRNVEGCLCLKFRTRRGSWHEPDDRIDGNAQDRKRRNRKWSHFSTWHDQWCLAAGEAQSKEILGAWIRWKYVVRHFQLIKLIGVDHRGPSPAIWPMCIHPEKTNNWENYHFIWRNATDYLQRPFHFGMRQITAFPQR